MRTYKEVQKTEEVLEDVTCDMCGGTCMKQFEVGANATKQFVGIHIQQPWGYLSNKDLQLWEADICEACVDEYLVQLIRFKTSSYIKGRLF